MTVECEHLPSYSIVIPQYAKVVKNIFAVLGDPSMIWQRKVVSRVNRLSVFFKRRKLHWLALVLPLFMPLGQPAVAYLWTVLSRVMPP